MNARRLTALLLALGIAPAVAHAQFDFLDEPPPPPWEQFKLNPKTRLKLDFRNASIDAVLQTFSEASGIPIIKDPALTGGITLQSPKQQTLTDAFAMLNAALGLKNCDLKKEGNFLIIRMRAQRTTTNRSNFSGFPGGGFPGGGFPGGGATTPQLKFYAIKFANASQIARVINEVFANSGQNLLQQMFGQGGFPGAGGGAPGGGGAPTAPAGGGNAPSETANAGPALGPTQVAALQGGFGGRQGRGGGGGNFGGGGFGQGGRGGFGGGGFGGGGFGQGGFGGFGRGGFGGGNNSVVRASADDYSNSVIVNAPLREQEQVANLIEQLDKQTDQPQQSRVFKLQYALAQDLTTVVQNILISNIPRGRGGLTAGGQGGFGGFGGGGFGGFGGGGFGGNRLNGLGSAIGQVVADQRLNALVVTATQENLEIVDKLIKELDKPVTFETSSFVITLENARADQIAQLLNQSFSGTRNGANTGRTNTGTGANRTNRTTTGGGGNNAGGLNTGGGAGRAQRQPGDSGLSGDEVALEADPATGELATTVSVQQGGFGGFGGGGFGQGNFGQGGARRNQTSSTTGLDSQGRVINVRDLTGQITAIPDINTNSVIIVTSPENRALLEKILEQLDKIPEQVMIETLIVEASLDASSKLGVEWNFSQAKVLGTDTKGAGSSSFGSQSNTAQPQGFRYTLTGKQYGAFLQGLQSDSRFEVLSTPRIFTSNNATAEINISQSLPYVLSQRTDVNGNLTFNYAFLDVGIILTVTPRITSNGYVTMDVTQTANDFVRYTDFNAPVVNQREAQTTVSVKDGETVVLGGIIKSSVSTTVNKLPVVGDIPVLGKLFQSTSQTKSKTELLVFLTPRVVRDTDEARRLREDTQKQMQAPSIKKLEHQLPTKSGAKPPVEEKKGESGG